MNEHTFNQLHSEIPQRKFIEEYLEESFFKSHLDMKFHVLEVVIEIQDHFHISNEASELKLKEGYRTGRLNTGTYLESLTHWAIYALFEKKLVKRVGPNQWTHVDSPFPGEVCAIIKTSKKEMETIMISVKILKDLNHTPIQIKQECKGKWSDAALDHAIGEVFGIDSLI